MNLLVIRRLHNNKFGGIPWWRNIKFSMKNDVWEVVPRLMHKFVVGSHWIYKIKHVVDSSTKRFKTRFVAKGFSQREVVGYDDTFTVVARYNFIRTMISLPTQMGWKFTRWPM
jgi:hypothetical protein